jgi:hypothetical protein
MYREPPASSAAVAPATSPALTDKNSVSAAESGPVMIVSFAFMVANRRLSQDEKRWSRCKCGKTGLSY